MNHQEIAEESQKIDAAEVLNSIAQLTPISGMIPSVEPQPTTNLKRPGTLSFSSSSIKPFNLTQVPPPLIVLKPNGLPDHLNKVESVNLVGGSQIKDKDKVIRPDPILTIPSLSPACNLTASDNLGAQFPLVRVPPALPTITISLPSTSQLVKQELSSMDKHSSTPSSTTASIPSNHVSLPSIPLPPLPKNVSKKVTSSRPTTLNIPKPLTVSNILMPKETLTSSNSSLLSLANVSAVQNHLPVLPPPTRHHLPGVSTLSSSNNTNLVPSISTINKNANPCAIDRPISGSSVLPAGLTIIPNTIIKQEIPNEDISSLPSTVISDASNRVSSLPSTVISDASNVVTSNNVNGNQSRKQSRKKSGRTKSDPKLSSEMKNGSNNNLNLERKQTPEETNDASTDMDLTGLSNEEKRKSLRRQRNKEAAARCRKRRLDQTLSLQDQVDQWLENRNELQSEIHELQNQETELQNILSLHQLTNCKLKDNTKLIKNSIVTTLEREAPISGGLGRLAAVAAAVSNSMQMAKKVEEGSNTFQEKDIKKSSSTKTRKANL